MGVSFFLRTTKRKDSRLLGIWKTLPSSRRPPAKQMVKLACRIGRLRLTTVHSLDKGIKRQSVFVSP
ncbi:hypothetical protein CEXT_279391 [Caerostris extrusa]|uniref:Uncharacterized protein n=1 Tax=Caerostris extrusa TaxID=172846 RepID=A0AAV4XHI7_CAEEX|nr:hypothetical protein CEXT_279391 [Caerostris extrusa]